MTPAADTRAAIDAANQKFMAAFGQQDSAGIASLYTLMDRCSRRTATS